MTGLDTERPVRRGWRLALVGLLALVAMAGLSNAAMAARITEFPVAGTLPDALIDGPDGNIWFVDSGAIGKITPTGVVTEFPYSLPAGSNLHEVVPGGDGNMWFDVDGGTQALGKLAPDGTFTTISPGMDGLNSGAVPGEMTAGPNGTIWFTDQSTTEPAIGRISATGVVKEFDYPNAMPQFESIAPGSDGNVWITDRGETPAVAKITPAGTITPYAVGMSPHQMPDGLTAGPDGKMWFTDEGTPPAIGTVPENGPATESSSGLASMDSRPDSIIAGPDGRLWFADQYSGGPAVGAVTPAATAAAAAVTEYPLTTGGPPQGIDNGIDGNVWATQYNPDGIARITPSGVITYFGDADGLPATSELSEEDILQGPDGNMWFIDRGTKKIDRINVQLAPKATTGAATAVGQLTATVAGSVNPQGADTTVTIQYGGSSVLGSSVSAGTLTASGTATPVTAALTGLPAGSTVFYRVVATNAYGTSTGTIQSFVTAPPTQIKVTTPPGATTRTIRSSVGNQQLSLVTPLPTACTANSKTLGVKLTSSTIAGSKAAKLRFVSASLFLDKGVKHVRRVTKRSHGKRATVKKTTYTANHIVRKLPGTPSLKLTGLKKGKHTLKVTVLFHKTVKRRGRKVTVSVRKTLTAPFSVC